MRGTPLMGPDVGPIGRPVGIGWLGVPEGPVGPGWPGSVPERGPEKGRRGLKTRRLSWIVCKREREVPYVASAEPRISFYC